MLNILTAPFLSQSVWSDMSLWTPAITVDCFRRTHFIIRISLVICLLGGGGVHLVMNYSSNDAVRRAEYIVLDIRIIDEEWTRKGVKGSGRGLFGGNIPDETPHDIRRPCSSPASKYASYELKWESLHVELLWSCAVMNALQQTGD